MSAAKAGHTEVVNLLLDKGANVNAINENGETAFARSIRSGNIEMILVLFDKTDINPTQLDEALFQASTFIRSEELCTKIAQILLDKATGLGVNVFNSTMKCLYSPNSAIVNPLLDRGLDINFIDRWSGTLLMHTARFGSTQYVKTLLDRGADVNIADNSGKTALMEATDVNIKNTSTPILDNILALLERGASINITDNDGETALMKAASSGFTEAVNVLLDRGADVNTANKNNETALMKAAHEGYTEIVEALLNKGANINYANKDNDTTLILAARPVPEKKGLEAFFSSHHKKTLEDSIATVNALLRANAAIPEDISEFPEAIQDIIEQERQTRRSRIKSAVKKGKSFPARTSREDGAGGVGSVGDIHSAGGTEIVFLSTKDQKVLDDQLIEAVKKGQTEIIKMLLNSGTNVNAIDNRGDTAITIAAKYNHKAAAQVLLNAGAEINDIVRRFLEEKRIV